MELSKGEATEVLRCIAQQQRFRRVWGPTARAALFPTP